VLFRPTVTASAARDVAIEIIDFEGAHAMGNRDAIGYYFETRNTPLGPKSRINVMFSGTVMVVQPQAFGLSEAQDRQTAFINFALAAIGDALDASGIPPETPSGGAPFLIECFSPHFQSWKDRAHASDDQVLRHIGAHAFWSWKYGHPVWRLGSVDSLRLNRTPSDMLRLARLGEPDDWTIPKLTTDGAKVTATSALVKRWRADQTQAPSAPSNPPTAMAPDFLYVDETRIADLKRLESPDFDLRKLVVLCEELNQCYRAQCYHAVGALNRAVLDHIPPILGKRSFGEIANNYGGGGRSFRDSMKHLEESARAIGDNHLHSQIRQQETLPTRVQVNFSQDLDVLLGELIRVIREREGTRN
jgi:hypothetical protein